MTENPNTSVVRNQGAERYEIVMGDADPTKVGPTKIIAGFIAFYESATHIAFTHTQVADAYQGQGFASRLLEGAAADAVARDLTIIPLCPYMAKYLENHEVAGARIEWPNRPPRS